MLRAVVTNSGEVFTVHLIQATTVPPNSGASTTTTAPAVATPVAVTATTEVEKTGPSPIAPETKELAWGGGSFVVFALLMRYFLFPKLKKGMDARYDGIQNDHAQADATRAAAKADVAEYQTQLAAVKAEAAGVIDAARQQLEANRTSRLATVNAEIAQQRAAAAAETEAARAAAQADVHAAVSDVAASAIEMATGKRPDPDVVSRAVDDVMSAGVSR